MIGTIFATCADCGEALASQFADFGSPNHHRCFACSMVARDREGLTLD